MCSIVSPEKQLEILVNKSQEKKDNRTNVTEMVHKLGEPL